LAHRPRQSRSDPAPSPVQGRSRPGLHRLCTGFGSQRDPAHHHPNAQPLAFVRLSAPENGRWAKRIDPVRQRLHPARSPTSSFGPPRASSRVRSAWAAGIGWWRKNSAIWQRFSKRHRARQLRGKTLQPRFFWGQEGIVCCAAWDQCEHAENWEQGQRQPAGPMKVLLRLPWPKAERTPQRRGGSQRGTAETGPRSAENRTGVHPRVHTAETGPRSARRDWGASPSPHRRDGTRSARRDWGASPSGEAA
jgi:hypothetical protein